MKAHSVILTILGVYCLLQVTTQSCRHAFVLWVAPRSSVLTRYEKTDQEILEAKSLEELITLYEAAREKVEAAQKDMTARQKREAAFSGEEPFESESKLKAAIQSWEGQHKELFQLHFYWWCGFAVLVAGLVGRSWLGRWFGLACLVTAFAEMLWWTSPAFNVLSPQVEFDRLVLWKLVYSVGTLALLLVGWFWFGTAWTEGKKSELTAQG